jgi:hypothetical protein
LLTGGCDRQAGFVNHDLSVEDSGFLPLTQYDLACVGSTAQSHLVPVSLVVMLDRSGSMGDGINGDPKLKWQPVTDALKAFFEDPASTGVSASLHYFPGSDMCNPDAYYTPAVSLRSLPDLAFRMSMDMTVPMGSTPTLPAVTGAIQYAQDAQAMDTTQRLAIVLVTDGDPDSCNSSVANVSLALSMVQKTIPTYVIGVGQDLMSLNNLATAGGTGSPTLVAVGDPTTTKTQFLAALDSIRGLVLSCDFPIPAAPVGQTIDFTQVNVTFTPSLSMQPELLPYDKDCSSGLAGWRYDDPMKPTQVELCPPSCAAARTDRDARIDLLFGCTTIGNLIM